VLPLKPVTIPPANATAWFATSSTVADRSSEAAVHVDRVGHSRTVVHANTE